MKFKGKLYEIDFHYREKERYLGSILILEEITFVYPGNKRNTLVMVLETSYREDSNLNKTVMVARHKLETIIDWCPVFKKEIDKYL